MSVRGNGYATRKYTTKYDHHEMRNRHFSEVQESAVEFCSERIGSVEEI